MGAFSPRLAARGKFEIAALAAFRQDNLNLTGVGEPERLRTEMISATFFPILRVKPVLGRVFSEQEDQLGGAPVIMISEGLWKRKFGGSPDVIGKSINLNAKLYAVAGVIPGNFHYQNNNFSAAPKCLCPSGNGTKNCSGIAALRWD